MFVYIDLKLNWQWKMNFSKGKMIFTYVLILLEYVSKYLPKVMLVMCSRLTGQGARALPIFGDFIK